MSCMRKAGNNMRRRRLNRKGWLLVAALAFMTGLGAGIGLSGHTGATSGNFQNPEFVAMKTVPMAVETQKEVHRIANEYGLDWTLLMAIIQKESRYNETAVSDCGDFGLMQINKINHRELSMTLGIHDFLNPTENVRAGAFLLRRLLDKYQDVNMALMAYNMGETGAAEWWDNGVYTSAYSREVISIQRELKRANREVIA